MTVYYSAEAQLLAPTGTGPQRSMPPGAVVGGRIRRYRNTITLAAQTTADTIQLGDIPAGSVFAYGMLTADTSLGTSTISVGYAGALTYFKAAGTFTATNTPTLFGNVAAQDDDPVTKTANVIPLVTIGTANLPASGTLIIDLFFSAV